MQSTTPNPDELKDLIAQASRGAPAGEPEQEASSPQATRRKAGFLAVLMVVLVGSTAWISIVANREPNPFTPEREELGLRALMFAAIETLEEHREDTGRYPPDLESIFLDEDEFAYRLTDGTFELVGRLPHRNLELVFRPGDDIAPYEIAMENSMWRDET